MAGPHKKLLKLHPQNFSIYHLDIEKPVIDISNRLLFNEHKRIFSLMNSGFGTLVLNLRELHTFFEAPRRNDLISGKYILIPAC